MSFAKFVRAGGASLVLSGACASREVPCAYPESSPASVEAPEGPSAQVTRALEGDPPLPGTQGAGWGGLEAPGATPPQHGEHADPGHAPHGSEEASEQGGHHHGH